MARVNQIKPEQFGSCLVQSMIPRLTLNEDCKQSRDSRKCAPSALELPSTCHLLAKTQASRFELAISFLAPFVALLLPLSALMLTSNKKLLNQEFSESILGLPGYAQGVWGLIYAVLFALCIWQALPNGRETQRGSSMRFPFAIICLINAIWLLIEAPIWSLGIELCWLISLIYAYHVLESDSAKTRKPWLAQVGMGLYLGWVTITTATTVSNVLHSSSWNGLLLPPVFWASIIILSLAGLGLFLALRYDDIFFNLALVWAFAGYIFRSPLDPALMPALMVALASTVFAIVREPQQKARPSFLKHSLKSRRTVPDL